MKEGASAPFFCSAIYCGRYGRARAPLPRLRSPRPPLVRISGRRRAAIASPCRPRCLHRWRRSGGARPRRAAIVPRSLCSLRDLRRYAGPAAPLALAACGSAPARRCAWLRAAVWRGSIRALPCGAARGPARSGGARRPLALGGGCAAARRRGWRGLAPAALRLGLRVLALAPLRRGGVGPVPAPSGLRAAPRASPAALPSRLRSRRGARGSRASPSLAAPARPAPRRRVVLELSRWCACGRGDGDSAACGWRG